MQSGCRLVSRTGPQALTESSYHTSPFPLTFDCHNVSNKVAVFSPFTSSQVHVTLIFFYLPKQSAALDSCCYETVSCCRELHGIMQQLLFRRPMWTILRSSFLGQNYRVSPLPTASRCSRNFFCPSGFMFLLVFEIY